MDLECIKLAYGTEHLRSRPWLLSRRALRQFPKHNRVGKKCFPSCDSDPRAISYTWPIAGTNRDPKRYAGGNTDSEWYANSFPDSNSHTTMRGCVDCANLS